MELENKCALGGLGEEREGGRKREGWWVNIYRVKEGGIYKYMCML